MTESTRRFGTIAIVGRPNVGKSTLLNHILGQKLAITSRKPQTTRHTLLGIHTDGPVQMAFVDTPGIHARAGNAMNRRMNRAAIGTLREVDVVVFVVDRDVFNAEDEAVLGHLRDLDDEPHRPVRIAVVNKLDTFARSDDVLPVLAALDARLEFEAIVPVSALRRRNLERLLEVLTRHLPEGEHRFGEDELTDRPMRFLAAEIVREKLTRRLGDELPYQCAVTIERFEEGPRRAIIHAQIMVEKVSQRAIVIGRGGSRLRTVGEEARHDIAELLGQPVHLELWVKVRQGWADNARLLAELGMEEGEGARGDSLPPPGSDGPGASEEA